MKKENLRYDAFNDYLMGVRKFNDKNIIRGLYSFGALESSPLVSRKEDLKEKTNYTNLSNDDFMSLFKADKFSNLDSKELKHLFQELHNRYIKGSGYEVTRNVAVVSDPEEAAYGYVCADNDLMFINKSAIDKAKKVDPKKDHFNKNNLGYSLFYILSHESQHVAQFESVIDYTLNNKDVKQSKEQQFMSAMMAIENINMAVDNTNCREDFTRQWELNYDYQFIEHNANYCAFKNTDNMIPVNDKKGEAYDQYNMFITRLALRKDVEKAQNPKDFVKARVAKMEKFANYEIDFFDKNVKDCPMKTRLMETIKDFMKVDENGNSQFRDKLNREVGEMMEVREQTLKNRSTLKNRKQNTQIDEMQL